MTFCHWIFFSCSKASDVNIVIIVNFVNLRKTQITDLFSNELIKVGNIRINLAISLSDTYYRTEGELEFLSYSHTERQRSGSFEVLTLAMMLGNGSGTHFGASQCIPMGPCHLT